MKGVDSQRTEPFDNARDESRLSSAIVYLLIKN